MHGMFEKSGEIVRRIYDNWGVGAFALPVLVVIALAGLALTHLDASNWMSEAIQAEFTSANYGPEAAPKQFAQPAGKLQAARAN